MSKIEKKQSKQKMVAMSLIHPNAAGIDIGDKFHAVAVPADRDDTPVRRFGAFTRDLVDLVKWLKECGIETVAMESTGVYWKNLFAVLVQEGFDVYLVNAKHTRNVTGKKTDESDAEWIQRLHSCGLLRTSFLPDDRTETLRTLVRHRRSLINDSTTAILRMQKSLELMNLKIHTVITDLMGKSGKAIVEAIIKGERKAENFLPLVDRRIKADEKTILKSLEGNWRGEHLFLLKQSYTMYEFIQQHITLCEQEIQVILQQMRVSTEESKPGDPIAVTTNKKVSKKKKNKNQPAFNTREYLKAIHGVDVMEIFGVSEISALEILAETGTDLSKWETEERYVSWLNLCPNKKITGGKLISSQLLKKKPNAASQAFRMSANAVRRSHHWLGDYFRRMRAKGGQKYAIVATARKIATIYYRMIRDKQPFTPFDYQTYQKKYVQAKITYIEKTLENLKKQVA
jgi:transposase